MIKNATTLSTEQIKNLLLNAAAFVDKDGALFTTDKYNVDPCEFRMYNSRQGCVEFSYDHCTFDHGKVTFETHDADVEQFTVLAAVTDVAELISK